MSSAEQRSAANQREGENDTRPTIFKGKTLVKTEQCKGSRVKLSCVQLISETGRRLFGVPNFSVTYKGNTLVKEQ